ncbi:quinone oxidoreductase family protein [Streptomyces endophyticus]|uniref:Zinc-binding dehydrogenase n=1 Tax=Streptomyces endophyticus TaxID=714166 RepID=A0ABU6F316_9ACTN|nr:zinc-binding dehydrogenase [Streptomyces endophyticus]MEB8338239.1 zinc-binding dehydrogenase [Streptomyces endophyticus]
MRALLSNDTRSSWTVAEVPPPAVGPDEVLVEVAAAGLNHADLLMLSGAYTPSSADWNVPLDRVGFEMAGRVRGVGARVTGIEPGQYVMAQTGGACAELVAVDHRLLLTAPESLGPALAAGLPSALLTEYDALTVAARLRPADRVLITGGAGGVGHIGIQLARALGASTVIATTRSRAKAELLLDLGATHVINTSTTDITSALGPGAFDVCLDHLGGAVLADLIGAAAPRARVVQIGRLAGTRAALDLELLAARRLQLIGTTFRGRDADELHALHADLRRDLPSLLRAHHVEPVIDSVFDLSEAGRAAERLADSALTGKVVLRMT